MLGHIKLAILARSGSGRQATVSEDRRVGVLFNEAIYNFMDLRSALTALRALFKTQTDAEVVVESYRAWGLPSLLGRLRGMFALRLWDGAKSRARFVRHSIGVKPPCHAVSGRALGFASTTRAQRATGFDTGLSDGAVAAALEAGYVPDPRRMRRRVSKPRPGHYLRWTKARDDGAPEFETIRYWSQTPARSTILPFEAAVDETERPFLQASRRRLEADEVPIAALLSGATASALVCWAASHLGAYIQAYTFGTPSHPREGSRAAAATARSLGIHDQRLSIDGAEVPAVGDLSRACSEPFACASAFGMLQVIDGRVATRAKNGFTISLERCLATDWRDPFEENLDGFRLASPGFLGADALHNCWRAVRLDSNAPWRVWYVHAVESSFRHEDLSARQLTVGSTL